MILQLYSECGTRILVLVEAHTVAPFPLEHQGQKSAIVKSSYRKHLRPSKEREMALHDPQSCKAQHLKLELTKARPHESCALEHSGGGI